MASNRTRKTFRTCAIAAAVVLALGGTAHAQLSTSTIKGQISSDSRPAVPGLVVTAVNQANGNTYRATTLADGSYVLAGLAPGSYEIRVAGPAGTARTEIVTVQVGETASLDLALSSTVTQERITVVGSALRKDVRTSEIGTNVSSKMIESLPQVTRNFLSSADLAPGVAFISDAGGNTKIQAGAQNFDHVNVFIDGVGQKNNILRGGLTGQDSSRGNPFPQSAIAEYKVLTQNYKAEFDQVSSAAITAITRSGTNEFHGGAYVDRTGTNWRTKTPFEQEREAQGVALPPSKKYEYGASIGGPIVRDQVHFFLAYDGKDIEDSRTVVPRNLNLLPAGAGIVPSLIGSQGATVDKFTEHLFFGKVDAQLSDEQKLSGSFLVRRESDRLPEDRNLSAPGNDKDRTNDETKLDLKHEWARGAWLSEARAGYEEATWNPQSASTTPFIKYKVSNSLTNQTLNNSQDVLFAGGSPDAQKRGQEGVFISEDLTYTGRPGHTIRGGAKFKNMKYDLSGTAFGVDVVETLIDRVTGQPYFNGTVCTGTTVTNNGQNSDQCRITRAIPGAAVSFKNNQFGLYIQDDWEINKRLEVNLGVRWDVESNMLNNDYVTPANRVAALYALDTTRYGITPPAGQTYAQSLARGGINVDNYIATGDGRKVYKGALAPRLGASYDLFGDRNTVAFAGFGRSYDRTMANHALDELQKNQQPGGEIWLIHNDFKMPFADQFTLGLRQGFGRWNTEVAVSQVYAKNQFVWFVGNRDPNGGFATQSPIDPLFGGPAGYGTLILGDFVGKTRTNSLFAKAEKPYTASSRWGVNIAYTYSDAQTTHREWNNDIFDFTYGKPGQGGFHPSTLVDKHRVVTAGVMDLPWGITGAAKATFASGNPRRIVDCSRGFSNCVTVEGDAPSFRQVDVSLSKGFAWGIHRFVVRADALNVFDTVNYGGFDDFGGGPVGAGGQGNSIGGDNLNLGRPNSIRGDPRTFRLSLSYSF